MTGPFWLAATFAAAMLMVAVYCAGRLVVSALGDRATERDVDGVHVAEGVAMAGMLVPRLNLPPGAVWDIVFGIAAGWFAWRAARVARRRGAAGYRAHHYLPHLAEAAAMLLMLAAVPAVRAVTGPGAGMSGPAGGNGLSVAGFILAVFLLGYVLWTADRMTALRAVGPPSGGVLVLAPRLAACCQIAVSVTMAYMLITML